MSTSSIPASVRAQRHLGFPWSAAKPKPDDEAAPEPGPPTGDGPGGGTGQSPATQSSSKRRRAGSEGGKQPS